MTIFLLRFEVGINEVNDGDNQRADLCAQNFLEICTIFAKYGQFYSHMQSDVFPNFPL